MKKILRGNRYSINLKYLEARSKILEETENDVLNILERYDEYTKGHSQNVARICKKLAIEMKYKEYAIVDVYLTGLLHDIGKTFISEEILNKRGPLTDEEYEIIKKHPITGYDILNKTCELEKIAKYVLHHHERYDGRGYPSGLECNEIPLVSSIVAVADAYDAMTTDRAYRRKFTKEFSVNEIINNSGKQFNPVVVKAFMKIHENNLI